MEVLEAAAATCSIATRLSTTFHGKRSFLRIGCPRLTYRFQTVASISRIGAQLLLLVVFFLRKVLFLQVSQRDFKGAGIANN